MSAYTPPATTNVQLELSPGTAYTPPSTTNIVLDFNASDQGQQVSDIFSTMVKTVNFLLF